MLLPPGRRRALALAGLVPLGLALASLSVTPGLSIEALPRWSLTADNAAGFLQGTAGLALLGLAGLGIGGSRSPLVLAVLLVTWLIRPLLTAAGLIPSLLVALGLGLGLGVLVLLMRVVRPGRLLLFLDAVPEGDRDKRMTIASMWGDRWGRVVLTAAAIGVVSPEATSLFLAAILSAVTVTLVSPRPGLRAGFPLAPVLSAIALGMALWYLLTVSGRLIQPVASLGNMPVSPVGERLVVGLLLVGAAGLTGLWPLHSMASGHILAPVAAVLIGRVAARAAPAGVEYWQRIALPLLIVGAWHGLARRGMATVLVAAGMFGLWTGTRAGSIGGALLVAAAVVPVASDTLSTRIRDLPRWTHAAGVTILGWGGYGVAEGGLAVEVAWTTLLGLTIAGALVDAAWPRRSVATPSV